MAAGHGLRLETLAGPELSPRHWIAMQRLYAANVGKHGGVRYLHPRFFDEIRQAFAAWSAVANIQFVEVPDSGLPFDAPGATGDIRIGAHVVDGPGGDFGHAFYPPPNSTTAAGDIHFDSQEAWSCTPAPGALDIGVVAAHQIGHSIGLAHDFEAPALMGPDYNPPRAAPFR